MGQADREASEDFEFHIEARAVKGRAALHHGRVGQPRGDAAQQVDPVHQAQCLLNDISGQGFFLGLVVCELEPQEQPTRFARPQ